MLFRGFALSEKHGIFSDMKSSSNTRLQTARSRTSIDAAIRGRIVRSTQRRVFTPVDFIDLGSRAAVDKVLSRMTASGELQRLDRGLYTRPRQHAILGTLMPTADEIAAALAGKGKLRLQPSGANAANLLGLSEQVPLKLVFLTDGVSRTVRVGGQQIILKHTTPRNMATAGRISGLVIQALRHLKQPRVDEHIVETLRRRLNAKDKALLITDAPLAPAWVAKIMHQVAAKKG
ncbi:MAG: DUF6088 family protein [Sterolibacterium sp.]|jgi:hypothetical protein